MPRTASRGRSGAAGNASPDALQSQMFEAPSQGRSATPKRTSTRKAKPKPLTGKYLLFPPGLPVLRRYKKDGEDYWLSGFEIFDKDQLVSTTRSGLTGATPRKTARLTEMHVINSARVGAPVRVPLTDLRPDLDRLDDYFNGPRKPDRWVPPPTDRYGDLPDRIYTFDEVYGFHGTEIKSEQVFEGWAIDNEVEELMLVGDWKNDYREDEH